MKGEPISKTLGYDSFKEEFKEVKTSAEQKFKEEEDNAMKGIDQTKEEQFKKLDEEKPEIPLYDDLPEKQQKEVFKKGEKEFAPQIKEQQDKMTKMIEEKLKDWGKWNYWEDGEIGEAVHIKRTSDKSAGGEIGGWID